MIPVITQESYHTSVLVERKTMTQYLLTVELLVLLLWPAAKGILVQEHCTRWPGLQTLVTNKAANVLEFDFGGNKKLEQELQESGRYDPKQIFGFDVQVDSTRNRIFLTTPLARSGTPASLSTLPADGGISATLLRPYPSFDAHRTTKDTITDCKAQLVSVITTTKTWSDPDTLYVLDSGVLDITRKPRPVCPPKIVIFDLRTDEVIKSTNISNAPCNSLYSIIRVDSCPDGSLVAYSSDSSGYQLTVTDLNTGTVKHLRSQYFHPKPGYFFVKAGGPPVYFTYGLGGLAADESCTGKLYLRAFSSNIQGVVDKKTIRNANNGDVLDRTTKVALPGRLSSNSGPMAVDATGERVFFPIVDELAIYCWNTRKPHRKSNFRLIVQDDKRFQYISSLEIDAGLLWIWSNPFTKYITDTIDYSADNYLLLYINISGLVC